MSALAVAAVLLSAAPVRSFALVIGYNHSDDPSVPALRFADDDAAQWGLALADLGAEVVVLAELDADSKPLFPSLNAGSPDSKGVQQALALLNRRMDLARAAGAETHFYFVYAGHGDVEHDEGYVHLRDGRLWRRQLWATMKASTAKVNHVVIDACKSYFVAFERGPGGERRPAMGPWRRLEGLPENTGVVVSTSSAADSHEWEAWGAGVFSHELRSALRGAADLDHDGRLSYDEVAGFVWAANARVPHARYRPAVFARAPRGSPGFFFDATQAPGDALLLTGAEGRHLFIEDGAGVRLADFHLKAAEEGLTLYVPSSRPLFVRDVAAEREAEVPVGRQVRFAELTFKAARAGRRGAAHVSFQRLFGEPFSRGSIASFLAGMMVTEQPVGLDDGRAGRAVMLGAGLAGLATGVVSFVVAMAVHGRGTPTTSGLERAALNRDIHAANVVTVSAVSVGLSLIAGAWAWWIATPRVEPRVLEREK